MTEEKWATHKNCDTAGRDHKWRWKVDPATGLPSDTIGVCAHCGIETELTRHTGLPGHTDKEQEV